MILIIYIFVIFSQPSLPVMIYTRLKKWVAGKLVARKTKSGAKQVKKSHKDNNKFAPDLADSEYFIAKASKL